ncbi:MAG: DUF1846 domain-containing protein [Candidatus Omnitrophica bacterium]|nr:DUF1846 domain-containing protein [Candidatus Omnitrophota bacterium]MCF7892240.1 DUF1846 domain-containing protein [Candidatus Omnitrophota bacterium]MCF7896135.1 DUF1846 domain-containing protein [Candidatus Omnitrophota bacterium]MCF7897790.1 DUF1846 domain-containing protein [Candidatus Omnitrophota bacterium]MCF7909184.1 DUF1846 domain-containing protein [Candidatus Omnitrophota bacterium]
MPKIIGFDNDKYLNQQTQAILERVKQFDNKLYLEFGGKLLFDYHAHRVLPGFDPNVKMRLLQKLKDKAEIILCIYAGDIERKKMRADFGITYDADALKVIDELAQWGLKLRAVVITRFDGQPAAKIFKNKLERRKIKVYTHQFTKGYPTDIDRIVSKEGYGANPYIKTKKSLVVVIGPGPGSGKLATCLSQLYHEHKKGIKAGYAKFETFPIWNLPLKHPVNVAYEAATADIKDYNMIDPFHLESYQQTAVNYNRDTEIFPVLKRILKKITKKADIYKSPTDMGVNRAGFGIVDDEIVKAAAAQEIIRRYFRYSCEYALGLADKETVERSRLLMEELNIKIEQRKVVKAARKASQEATKKRKEQSECFSAAAIELDDSKLITGKSSSLMHAPSSLVLNAVKVLSGIPDKIHLLSPNTIKSIKRLKKSISKAKTASLDLEETLIALSISASTNPTAALALENLKKIKDKEVHLTHIPSSGDEAGLRRLGVNLTSDPNFSSSSLFFE